MRLPRFKSEHACHKHGWGDGQLAQVLTWSAFLGSKQSPKQKGWRFFLSLQDWRKKDKGGFGLGTA